MLSKTIDHLNSIMSEEIKSVDRCETIRVNCNDSCKHAAHIVMQSQVVFYKHLEYDNVVAMTLVCVCVIFLQYS